MNESGFTIDLSQQPYGVPCPVCLAWALEPCRTERKEYRTGEPPSILSPLYGKVAAWPVSSRILEHPHEERVIHDARHPEFRVKAIL